MMRVRVKICGITRLEDARARGRARRRRDRVRVLAEEPAGDLARRRARESPTRCRRSSRASACSSIASPRRGREAVGRASDSTRCSCTATRRRPRLRALPARVIKVVDARVRRRRASASRRWPADVMLLVDAADRERRGGTGRVANWTRAAEVSRARPIVLAGGLTADNVARGDSRACGRGPSTCRRASRRRPGVKSAERMRAVLRGRGRA